MNGGRFEEVLLWWFKNVGNGGGLGS